MNIRCWQTLRLILLTALVWSIMLSYNVALVEPGPIPSLSVQSASHWPISGLPGLPVLAFLIRNVFVAAVVPKMAAGCPPEVTLISIHRATPSWSEDTKGCGMPNHSPTVSTWEIATRLVLTRQRAPPAV